jgi:hypothetical protein
LSAAAREGPEESQNRFVAGRFPSPPPALSIVVVIINVDLTGHLPTFIISSPSSVFASLKASTSHPHQLSVISAGLLDK